MGGSDNSFFIALKFKFCKFLNRSQSGSREVKELGRCLSERDAGHALELSALTPEPLWWATTPFHSFSSCKLGLADFQFARAKLGSASFRAGMREAFLCGAKSPEGLIGYESKHKKWNGLLFAEDFFSLGVWAAGSNIFSTSPNLLCLWVLIVWFK
ncbi:hypothetical protein [uncultured Bacteroides sp.]|uniref:hypothetical protein n=1 Tax=uncultured Bacteroides sp. TaxID=162156 RepID=UPI0026285A88|nr:hypothetical protein [uncultured Bacteroides sp.]